MKTAIIGDDSSIIKELNRCLKYTMTINNIVTVEYKKAHDFIKFYDRCPHYFDVIFIDADMPDISGIEVAKHVKRVNEQELIVFLATFKDKKIIAEICRLGATYLLFKPINDEGVKEAWKFIHKQFLRIRGQYIIIKERTNLYRIRIDDIMHIESNHRTLTVFCINATYSYSGRFSDIKERLLPYGFYQIRKGSMVNLKYVTATDKKLFQAIITNGTRLSISQRCFNKFCIYTNDYYGNNTFSG